MRFLTMIATLLVPLSFIAGLYGMDFNTPTSTWNMPELDCTMGYPFALGPLFCTVGRLICFFWRRGGLS